MKKSIHFRFLSAVAAGLLTACSSSQSHHASVAQQTGTEFKEPSFPSKENVETAPPPVVVPPERSHKVESIVRVVLDAHGFVPPVVMEGRNGVAWALSTRPGSDRELVLASVKMGPENEASVELLLYAHIGSTWALLGHKLSGSTDQEARDMTDQIRERLVR